MEQINGTILDVTQVEPKRKHPLIFELFDALEPGNKLTLLNDHDPKPLYYQLLAERGQIFKWNYLESGPVNWKVEITRNRLDDKEETIGEMSRSDIRKIEVFKRFGIDFCCGGNKTLQEACGEKGIDILKVKEALDQSQDSSKDSMAYDEWNLNFLSEYIVQRHHNYVRKQVPILLEISKKVMGAHSNAHPELKGLNSLIESLCAELNAHIHKEEIVLFPYIRQIEFADKNGETLPMPAFGSVHTPINIMMMEHESAGEILEEMNTLTDNYTLPVDACNSYNYLFEIIKAFEDDLKLHIHLENNILFPKAIAIEKRILQIH